MIEWKNNKLFVGFHKWAWSRRTEGFPVFAVVNNKKFIYIGETQKRATAYELPEGTKFVVRYYESNRGLRYWYIYFLHKGAVKEYELSENWHFSFPDFETFTKNVLLASEDDKEAKLLWLQLKNLAEILKEASFETKRKRNVREILESYAMESEGK